MLGTTPLELVKVIAPLVTVAGSIASLNVTVTTVWTLTPTAPLVGLTDTITGALVSGPELSTKTTSTQ